MATEKGIVTKTGPGTAWVKTLLAEACEGCASCGSCNAQRPDTEVEVINEVGAEVGDRILLDFKTASFLKITFLLYIFPIICLTLGAILGLRVAQDFGYDQSACSAIVGFAGFFVSVAIIRVAGRRLARKKNYRPQITKILPPMARSFTPPRHCEV
ncbi:MAG: SoxR reducing system RseC family protein [Desulfosarcina sp.]|nr:SoxR reducing system RseC family protein [Desulfobacterales bacterium]